MSQSKQELSNVFSTSIMDGKPIKFDFRQEASSTMNTGPLRLTKQITDPNDINLQFMKDPNGGGQQRKKPHREYNKPAPNE